MKTVTIRGVYPIEKYLLCHVGPESNLHIQQTLFANVIDNPTTLAARAD